MLEAAGYTGDQETSKKGALTAVSNRLDVPLSTLRRWFIKQQNPPPADLVNEKREDLRKLIDDELHEIFAEMGSARPDASYRDLGWVAGVLFDKKQILDGQPTAIIKLQKAIEKGIVSPEQAKERWPNLADKLFEEAGINGGS
jgi:hypothetical protein